MLLRIKQCMLESILLALAVKGWKFGMDIKLT